MTLTLLVFRKLAKFSIFASAIILLIAFMAIPAAWLERTPDHFATSTATDRLIINNVNIIDVRDGSVLADRQLDIANGRINAINTNPIACPSNAGCIDAQGGFAIPGLTDMHVHVYDRQDLVVNLAYGVTRVRNMRGMPMHLRWKQELLNQEWLGADLITSSPILDHANSDVFQQPVKTPDHAKQLVNRYKEMGFDLIKVYGYIEPDNLAAIIEEATRINMPVAKHGPHGAFTGSQTESHKSIAPLITVSGLQSLEHVEDVFQGPLNFEFNAEKLDAYIKELSAIEANVVPTLATFNHLTELSVGKLDYVDTLPLEQLNPFFRFLNEQFSVLRWLDASAEHAEWNLKEREFLFAITKALSDADIPLLVGSDAGTMYMSAGRSTIEEMQLMQKAGVPELKILQGATILAEQSLGNESESGSIEVGKKADLVLLEDNPISNLTTLKSPKAVVKNGHWLDQDKLEELKNSTNSPSGYYTSFGRLFESILMRFWHSM